MLKLVGTEAGRNTFVFMYLSKIFLIVKKDV